MKTVINVITSPIKSALINVGTTTSTLTIINSITTTKSTTVIGQPRNGIPDAPSDGIPYARRDNDWVVVDATQSVGDGLKIVDGEIRYNLNSLPRV